MLWPKLARQLFRPPVTAPAPLGSPEAAAALAARLDGAARLRLGRSLAIRVVDCGGCNGCLLEVAALQNPVHDLERFGLRFVASPRHADVLMLSGPLTRTMREALEQAYVATPDPKWVVAVGDCAVDGGVFKGGHAVEGGVGAAVPVDLIIPGCPPAPEQLLSGLLSLLEAEQEPVRPQAL
jgi:Ni,Fe-hydrogenase III small subunit